MTRENRISILKSIFLSRRANLSLSIALFICVIGMATFTCIHPLILAKMLHVTVDEHNIILLTKLTVLMAVLYLINVLCNYLQNIFSSMLGVKLTSRLQMHLFYYLQNLKRTDSLTEESYLLGLMNDTAFLRHVYIHTASIVLQYSIISIVSVGLLFYINPSITLLVITVLCITILVFHRYFSNKAKLYEIDKNIYDSKFVSLAKDANTFKHEIKYLNIKNTKRHTFKEILKYSSRFNYLYNVYIAHSSRSMMLGANLISLAMFVTGLYFILGHWMTLGDLIAYSILLGNLGNSINLLSAQVPNLLKGNASLSNINRLLADKTVYQRYGAYDLKPIKHNIVFQHVSADMKEEHIVSDLNLTILKGQSIAIVGASGAGKSTILNLLLREVPLSQGKILIDGKDLQSFSSKSLYSQICIVPQQPRLFMTSIRENICLGNCNATEEDMIKAAKAAGIHEDIIRFTDGYDTVISETAKLSGGQTQRIFIARALISSASILCLDEITSALDPVSAATIDETIAQLQKNITIITITHRLQSAVNKDVIFVMQNGKITGHGKHAELLKTNEYYYNLWQKQHNITLTGTNDVHIGRYILRNIPIFNQLDDLTLDLLAKNFSLENVNADTVIFNEGDFGDKFYIIASGVVSVLSDKIGPQRVITQLSEGDFFGEIALLYGAPRNATVKTVGECTLCVIHREQFYKIFNSLPLPIQLKIKEIANARRLTNHEV